jgi:hypothetical protein
MKLFTHNILSKLVQETERNTTNEYGTKNSCRMLNQRKATLGKTSEKDDGTMYIRY